ncbi:hypothetical protein JCM10212_003248 [Sporobolomyces blumeae]
MSLTFTMIPILVLTPPSPAPSRSPTASLRLIVDREREATLKHASDIRGGSLQDTTAAADVRPRNSVVGFSFRRSRWGTLPFQNLDLVPSSQALIYNKQPHENDELSDASWTKVVRKGRRRPRRRREDKAKSVIHVEKKLEDALSQLGW